MGSEKGTEKGNRKGTEKGTGYFSRIPIDPGMVGQLKAAAKDALPNTESGIHFARLVVIEEKAGEAPHLMLGVIFDGCRDRAIDFLFANGSRLESVFRFCIGYQNDTTADKAKLKTFIESHEVDTKFLYPKYQTSAEDIDHAVRLRHRFLVFLRKWQLGEGALQTLYQSLLDDYADPPKLPPQAQPVSAVFDPHRTNALNMVHRIKSGKLVEFELRMLLARLMIVVSRQVF